MSTFFRNYCNIDILLPKITNCSYIASIVRDIFPPDVHVGAHEIFFSCFPPPKIIRYSMLVIIKNDFHVRCDQYWNDNFQRAKRGYSRLLLTENCLMHETINVLTEQLFPGKSTISDVLSVTGNQIQRLQLVESFRLRLWKIGQFDTQHDNTRPYWTVNICSTETKGGGGRGGIVTMEKYKRETNSRKTTA